MFVIGDRVTISGKITERIENAKGVFYEVKWGDGSQYPFSSSAKVEEKALTKEGEK